MRICSQTAPRLCPLYIMAVLSIALLATNRLQMSCRYRTSLGTALHWIVGQLSSLTIAPTAVSGEEP